MATAAWISNCDAPANAAMSPQPQWLPPVPSNTTAAGPHARSNVRSLLSIRTSQVPGCTAVHFCCPAGRHGGDGAHKVGDIPPHVGASADTVSVGAISTVTAVPSIVSAIYAAIHEARPPSFHQWVSASATACP